jgi:hypothetical protein
MDVTPNRFSGDETSINISLRSENLIDNLKIYINDNLLLEDWNVAIADYPVTPIRDTSVIRCVATILGMEYT